MDPRLEQYLKEHCGPNHYGEQDENGVDLSLLRENLKLSVEERLARASRARLSALELRKLGRLASQK